MSVTSNGNTATTGGLHGDHGVDFTDLTGTSTFTSANISNNADSNVVVSNNSGTSNLNITGLSHNHLARGAQ